MLTLMDLWDSLEMNAWAPRTKSSHAARMSMASAVQVSQIIQIVRSFKNCDRLSCWKLYCGKGLLLIANR